MAVRREERTLVRMFNKSLAASAVLAVAALAGSVGTASAAAPTAAQQKAFAALRGAPATSVPAAVSRFVDSATGRKYGVDDRNVHRVPAPGGGFWSVLPGNGGVCIVFETKENVSSCADDAHAMAGGLQALLITPKQPALGGPRTSATDGPATQVGLVPSDITSATATLQSGDATGVAPNPSGLYAVKSGFPLTSLTLHRAGKRSLVIKSGASGPFKPRAPIAHAAAFAHFWVFCQGSYNNICVIAGTNNWSPLLPIGVEYLQDYDGWPLCGNLANTDGTWAGTTFCTVGAWNPVEHLYNQTNRYGWTGPGPGVAQLLGTANLGYN